MRIPTKTTKLGLVGLAVSLFLASLSAQSPPSTERVRECERQVRFYQNRITDYQVRLSQGKTSADRRTQESNIQSASASLKTWQDSLVQAQREYDRRIEDYLNKQKSKLPPAGTPPNLQRNTDRLRECERQVRFYENKITDYQLRLSKAKSDADRRTQENNVRSATASLKTWQDSLVKAQGTR